MSVKAPRQEGFDMIKMVNFYNDCDVNRELCNTHLFLWRFCIFPIGGIEYKQYSSSQRCSQTPSM